MHFFAGCMSGAKASTVPVTDCALQGMTITLRNSTASKIQPWYSTVNKVSESSDIGDFARSSTDYYIADSSDILVAASVNAKDNGPFVATQYQVPGAFTNWDNHGSVSAIGLRLGVASNDVLGAYPSPEQVDFQQNFAGEDSATMLIRYYTSTGFITYVDEGTKVLVEDGSTLTLPIGASSVAGDTVVLVVMHELSLNQPDEFITDFTTKIKGNSIGLSALERNTSLTLYRKVLTSSDIVVGSFTLNTSGSIPNEPEYLSLTGESGLINLSGEAGNILLNT